MGDLSYKELQEKGVFDVPYKAFQFMQEQQAIIDDLRQRSKDEFISITKEWHTKGWNARQGEIDDLRQQLNNMEQCYIDLKKERDELQSKSQCIRNLVEQRNLAENMLKKISVAAQKKLPTFGAALRFNDEVKEILRGEYE